MEKKRLEGRDLLIIRAESEESKDHWPSIEKLICEKIVASRPTLKKALENQSIFGVKVEIQPPGTIEQNKRTGKLVRVIDVVKDS